jgi:hypothetical protein
VQDYQKQDKIPLKNKKYKLTIKDKKITEAILNFNRN